MASPINPDGAPEFTGPGCTGTSAACDGLASSSISGIDSTVHVVKPHVDDYCDAGSIASTTVATADAVAGEKANADPTATGIKRKLPSTFNAHDNAGASAASSGDKRVLDQPSGHLEVLVKIGRSKLGRIGPEWPRRFRHLIPMMH